MLEVSKIIYNSESENNDKENVNDNKFVKSKTIKITKT